MKSSIKSALTSVLFGLLMLLSLSVFNIESHATQGSALTPVLDANANFGKGGDFGAIGVTKDFRIRLVEITGNENGNFDYFKAGVSNNLLIDEITLKANVTSAEEGNSDKWAIIHCENEGNRTYSYYTDGKLYKRKGFGFTSPEAKELKRILNWKGNFEDWVALDQALQAYAPKEGKDELLDYFNMPQETNYYIVLEALQGVVDNTAPVNGEDWSARRCYSTYQDIKYREDTFTVMGGGKLLKEGSRASLSDPSHYIHQGAIAPFGEFAAGGNKKAGYALYGDPELTKDPDAALNIVVEYKGDPNTTNGEFVAAASLIQNANGKNRYWSINNNDWVNTSDNDKLLRVSANKVETADPPYTVVWEDTYKIKSSSSALFASELIQSGQATLSNYTIEWGTPLVKTGDENVGRSITPISLDSRTDTYPIMKKFLAAIQKNTTSSGRKANSKATATGMKIINKLFENAEVARGRTDGSVVKTHKSTGELKLMKGKEMGVGIEFIVKGKDVESYKVTVDAPKNLPATAKETWKDKYSSAGSSSTSIQSMAVCYLAVPNTARNDMAVTQALSNKVFTNARDVLDTAKEALGIDNVVLGKVDSGITIGVGCTEDTVEGYTIYEIIQSQGIETPVVGSVELPAYMLNRYFPNIIQYSSAKVGSPIKYQVNKQFTVIKEDYTGESTCIQCSATLTPTTRPAEYKDWRVEWKDSSGGTPHTNYDNASKNTYFVRMPSGVWEKSDRITLSSWVSQDTEYWDAESKKILDYGFNLIRASVGDNRSLSGIKYENYASVDSENMLHLSEYFGVVPSSVLSAERKRDSTAKAGVVSDTLTVLSRFTRYSGTGFSELVEKHQHDAVWDYIPGEGNNPGTSVLVYPAVNITYYTFEDKTALGFRRNGSPVATLSYTFRSTVYKYETEVIATGKNSKISGSSTAIGVVAQKPNEGLVTNDNGYRFANVRNTGIIQNFYPEVKMVAKFGGKVYNSNPYSWFNTMGEVMRTAESSSLYLFKINGTGEDAVQGTTYSDAAQGGSAVKGKNLVTIPAGADVYVAADPKGISVDLFGYALDTINADTDAQFKTSSTITRDYRSVVKSGENVDTIWNGQPNKPALVSHFSDWADKILDINNFSADFELYTNSSKKADNFSAVVGSIKRNNTISEDGVYQLEVVKGKLVENADYNGMIQQIASDYVCTTAQAKELFEASGIYTAIINAIESCDKPFNKSGTAVPGNSDSNSLSGSSDWTNVLGGNGNWYDEEVHTFVVRRFTNIGNQIKDITATDKIDYGLAPSASNNSNKQNSTLGATNSASWKLNVFFNPEKNSEVNDLLVGSGSYYNPTGNGVSITSARDSYTLLMYRVPVKNADFNISVSSTSSFGY